MRDITLVLPHFCNLGMLAEQQAVWACYPEELRARLHVVIVDDCSPADLAPTPQHLTFRDLASLRLYRLQEKKRWNWLTCRNLGADVATTEWLLMTDMDHVVPAATFQRLMTMKLKPEDAHTFGRIDAPHPWPYALEPVRQIGKVVWHGDCRSYKAHNDSWFLTRSLFFDDRVGGYDERLAGCYGTSSEFTARLLAAARAHKRLNECVLIRYPREVIADASTSPAVYTRKDDPVNDADLRARRLARDEIKEWRPLRLTIPWEQVA